MEDVLDVYALPLDPHAPRVCFDECPYQLLDDVREPLLPLPGKPAREDYEYEREGTCNLFLFVEPTIGWRHVEVTKRRTKQDFAQAMKDLVDIHFPDAPLIRVVLDNLNTHTPGSLYETFEPEEARRILRRLEIHYTRHPRKLVEHGGDRVECSGTSMSGPTSAHDAAGECRGYSLATGAQ